MTTDPSPATTVDAPDLDVNGARMPALGLGTWQMEGADCVVAVRDALDLGYRLVDTAEAYGNEAEVGEGLRRSSVDRDEVWITTKVWWTNLSHDECLASVRASLDRLGLDRLDLVLIHWPGGDAPLEEPLSALTELRRGSAVREIGVSNFTPSLLEKAAAEAPVVCNQVEYHPYLAQDAVLRAARRHGLATTAYSPLARGRVADDPTLTEIGRVHGKTTAQVALRWLIQQPGVAAIPRAASPDHRRENLDIFDFELTDDEMTRIHGLDQGLRLTDPEFAPTWDR